MDACEPPDLDSGESLEVDVWQRIRKRAKHVDVVIEWKIRVQAVDDVEFGDGQGGHGRACGRDRLGDGHGVGTGLAIVTPEGAERALGLADVGQVQVAVDIEKDGVAGNATLRVAGQRRIGVHRHAPCVQSRPGCGLAGPAIFRGRAGTRARMPCLTLWRCLPATFRRRRTVCSPQADPEGPGRRPSVRGHPRLPAGPKGLGAGRSLRNQWHLINRE
ncbi:MAG: hypothetical protein EBT22_12405 [Chloroflexi bacterium]|nr:hypothetical protein [Chloroflexota bacterium]